MAIMSIITGAQVTLFSTELNGLTNNAAILSTGNLAGVSGVFTNNALGSGLGYPFCDVELYLNNGMNGAMTGNACVALWFLQSIDGTTYEDGSSSVIPPKFPNVIFPLRNISGAQRVDIRGIELPEGSFYGLAQNSGTAVTLALAGNTVKIRPYTYQFI